MVTYPKPPYVLLEDSKSKNRTNAGFLFQDPIEILTCSDLENVKETLEKIEQFQGSGYYLAGWFCYECAFPYHPTLKNLKPPLSQEPLIWLGVFETPQRLSSPDLDNLFTESHSISAGFANKFSPSEGEKEFNNAFEQIQTYISEGDVYQINHTFRLGLQSFGNARTIYANLRRAQPTPYSSLIETGKWGVLSTSPELFVSRQGSSLTSRPMKGTAKPGKTLAENQQRLKALQQDEKNRAENLMITDLIRNDFSKICQPGTVKAEKLFEVEAFSTVLQMSSEVTGELKDKTSFGDIFRALFPCGSITGAPKVRAMEIIQETEKGPRGIYTGAVGFIAPEGDFAFNIPIRTAVMEANGKGWLGIGSGIVADSTAGSEFQECLLKSKFLQNNPFNFSLVETMLWSKKEGFHYLEDHFGRLACSAEYFDFVYPEAEIKKALEGLSGAFDTPSGNKIRLLLDRLGHFTLTYEPLPATAKQTRIIRLSETNVNSDDPFLFHKTTHRPIYNDEFARQKNDEKVYDLIFQNEKDEITEGAFNNIFIEKNGPLLLTPRANCGLLPGIFRAKLIESGRAKETSLRIDDLNNAKKIYLGNSVRGLVEVKLDI